MKDWHIGYWLLVLVLMSSLCGADLTQNCSCSGDSLHFANAAHSPVRSVDSSAGSLEPLYNFARLFLQAVQPNAFPKDIAHRALNNEKQDISEVLWYEAGYLVCLILAVLYLVLVPLMGVILCWRHYHRNTESSAQSSLLPSWQYRDIAIATCLAVITILLLTGVILAFTTNNRARQNMEPSLHHLSSSLRDIRNTFGSVSQKIDIIVDQYSVAMAAIQKELNGTGDVIGQEIISSFHSNVNDALTDFSISVEDAVRAKTNLVVIHTARADLQPRHNFLQIELGKLKQSLQKIQDMCQNCSLPPFNNLQTDANYRKIPDVKLHLDKVAPAASLANLAEKGNASFNAIPENCTKQTAPTVKDLVLDLEETKTSLTRSSQRFPSLKSFSEVFSELGETVSRYGKDVDRYDYYRWGVSVAVCTVILVIVLLTALSLCLGLPAVYCPSMWTTSSEGRFEQSAVSLLRVAVVLSFLFSWLFIILVFITLLFAGNVYTIGCRSYRSGELFEFLDQRDNLFSSLNTSNFDHNSTSQFNFSTQLNFSVQQVYIGCKTGQSLFHSMHLDQLFDMEDFVNATKYMAKFKQNARNLSVDLRDLQLLPPEGRQSLLYFRESGIDNIDYPTLMLLLSTPVLKINLKDFADQLDETAQLQTNNTIKEDLESKANRSRELQKYVEQQEADVKKMDASLRALSVISANFKENIDTALDSISMTEQEILRQVPIIVHNVSQCLSQRGEHALRQYLDWVNHAILNEALECRWFTVSLDNMYTALCQNIADPWNGFWLCLGWCCVLLIPGVICSLSTARHLQPMSSSSSKNALIDKETTTQKTEPKSHKKPVSLKITHGLGDWYKAMKKTANEKK
ncbi:prominin-2-like [Megalops cyprinoides]|uniref:prominin-2-like n=1 Tax=Megalops cyprinoides TaxID=118141 RepID=UPI001864E1F3|nr:prominin-2-like [Megalops cyprinoides]